MKKNLVLDVALTVAWIIAILGFFTDVYNTHKFGGVDLRNRVVAARVTQELHQDPYYFKWNNGLSDHYLDPSDNILIPVSRVTVPPTVLLFHNLFSFLPYSFERWIWFIFQWICLLLSIYLLTRLTNSEVTKKLIWILGFFFISGSYFWRLHVERGQIYIFYTALFILSVYLYKKFIESEKNIKSASKLLAGSGLILGYLISLRPTFIFALLPFFLYKKFKFVAISISGIIFSIILTSLFIPLPLWQNYYHSIQFQGLMRISPDANFQSVGIDVAEGFNMRNFLDVPGEDSSLQRIIHGLFKTWPTSNQMLILLFLFFAGLTFYLLKTKKWGVAGLELFFLGSIFSFFSEFFTPAPRWPYANVIWLIPLGLFLIESEKISVKSAPLFLTYTLLLLALFSNIGFSLIPHFMLLGDVALVLALLLAFQVILKNKKAATIATTNA